MVNKPAHQKKPILTYGKGGRDEIFLDEGFERARKCKYKKTCSNHFIKCWTCIDYQYYEPTARGVEDKKFYPRQVT